MNHHIPPDISKKQVNRAGEILKSYEPDTAEYQEALEIANKWRLAHVYPINTFQARLRKTVRKYPSALVAQRLKRMPTIIDKLDRHPHMKLSTMQDIGGVRAVLKDVKAVYDVTHKYETSKRFTHELKERRDYIESPKADGYRGIHLIYRYNNTLARNDLADAYKGLMVEVQLRTKEQHAWATAVEATGIMLDQPFKTRGGDKDWSEFFALMSSAIAIVEHTKPLQQHQDLQPIEIYQHIAQKAAKIKALEKLQGYNVAVKIMEQRSNGFYNLVLLDTQKKTVQITAYAKKDYKRAVAAYSAAEQKLTEDQDVVLVSAGKLKSLKIAYPNYFLDIKDFLERVKVILEEVSR